MVFRPYVAMLMNLTWNIAYIYEATRKTIDHNIRCKVKGDAYILAALTRSIPSVTILIGSIEEAKTILSEMESWKNRLEKNYVEEYFKEKESNLILNDAKKLQEDCLRWYQALGIYYAKPVTELINEVTLLQEIIKLSKMVGSQGPNDLNDAYLCLGHGLATPAVMIMNRVGELMVRKFYKKLMKQDPPTKATWWTLEKELKKKLGENDPIVALLQYRRGKRNMAQHPGARFNQKEAEQIFFNIKELIEEINLRLKKIR